MGKRVEKPKARLALTEGGASGRVRTGNSSTGIAFELKAETNPHDQLQVLLRETYVRRVCHLRDIDLLSR